MQLEESFADKTVIMLTRERGEARSITTEGEKLRKRGENFHSNMIYCPKLLYYKTKKSNSKQINLNLNLFCSYYLHQCNYTRSIYVQYCIFYLGKSAACVYSVENLVRGCQMVHKMSLARFSPSLSLFVSFLASSTQNHENYRGFSVQRGEHYGQIPQQEHIYCIILHSAD